MSGCFLVPLAWALLEGCPEEEPWAYGDMAVRPVFSEEKALSVPSHQHSAMALLMAGTGPDSDQVQ